MTHKYVQFACIFKCGLHAYPYWPIQMLPIPCKFPDVVQIQEQNSADNSEET